MQHLERSTKLNGSTTKVHHLFTVLAPEVRTSRLGIEGRREKGRRSSRTENDHKVTETTSDEVTAAESICFRQNDAFGHADPSQSRTTVVIEEGKKSPSSFGAFHMTPLAWEDY